VLEKNGAGSGCAASVRARSVAATNDVIVRQAWWASAVVCGLFQSITRAGIGGSGIGIASMGLVASFVAKASDSIGVSAVRMLVRFGVAARRWLDFYRGSPIHLRAAREGAVIS
jgi:hypothetical protein